MMDYEEPKECRVCENNGNEYCFACDNGSQFKPMTNADRLRAMSDEELAKMINGFESFALDCGGAWSTENWLEWLRQEATP